MWAKSRACTHSPVAPSSFAALAGLVLAATASADTGSNGGTAAPKSPPLQQSGGVAGPDKAEADAEPDPAHSSQTTTPEEPP